MEGMGNWPLFRVRSVNDNTLQYIHTIFILLRDRYTGFTHLAMWKPFSRTDRKYSTRHWRQYSISSTACYGRLYLLAPVQLKLFRSNLIEICSTLVLDVFYRSIFCTRHDSITVVMCAKLRCELPNVLWSAVRSLILFRIRWKYRKWGGCLLVLRSGELARYHGCWCHFFLRRQNISSNGTDYLG